VFDEQSYTGPPGSYEVGVGHGGRAGAGHRARGGGRSACGGGGAIVLAVLGSRGDRRGPRGVGLAAIRLWLRQ
jgi:hypothetical protein